MPQNTDLYKSSNFDFSRWLNRQVGKKKKKTAVNAITYEYTEIQNGDNKLHERTIKK